MFVLSGAEPFIDLSVELSLYLDYLGDDGRWALFLCYPFALTLILFLNSNQWLRLEHFFLNLHLVRQVNLFVFV